MLRTDLLAETALVAGRNESCGPGAIPGKGSGPNGDIDLLMDPLRGLCLQPQDIAGLYAVVAGAADAAGNLRHRLFLGKPVSRSRVYGCGLLQILHPHADSGFRIRNRLIHESRFQVFLHGYGRADSVCQGLHRRSAEDSAAHEDAVFFCCKGASVRRGKAKALSALACGNVDSIVCIADFLQGSDSLTGPELRFFKLELILNLCVKGIRVHHGPSLSAKDIRCLVQCNLVLVVGKAQRTAETRESAADDCNRFAPGGHIEIVRSFPSRKIYGCLFQEIYSHRAVYSIPDAGLLTGMIADLRHDGGKGGCRLENPVGRIEASLLPLILQRLDIHKKRTCRLTVGRVILITFVLQCFLKIFQKAHIIPPGSCNIHVKRTAAGSAAVPTDRFILL